MKKLYILSGLICLLALSAKSQITTGGFHANFGVDADTKSGYTKYGPSASSNAGDDWFAGIRGNGVIDTTGAANLKSLLQSYKNISFSRGMSVPAYTKMNNQLWIDALYMRDFVATPKDSTTFNSGENGQNPANWRGGVNYLYEQNDIVDAYAHFRRNGSSAKDSLWFFAGVSTVENDVDRYVDIELFNKNVTYNRANGTFNTGGGLQNGHTEWLFDATGKAIQTGDVLITIVFDAGMRPTVDVHIWVSRVTVLATNPNLFKFGSTFLSSGISPYGYVNIIPKSSTAITGSAIMNSSTNTSRDTTYSTPWGTMNTSEGWSSRYSTNQSVELGLNFSKIGIDPASYPLTSLLSCEKLYQSIIFKSGRYTSTFGGTTFGSEPWGEEEAVTQEITTYCHDNNEQLILEDFAGPFTFSSPTIDFTVTSDTLTCVKTVGNLVVNKTSSLGLFSWSTLDGGILSSNADSTNISINKKGTYKLTATLVGGCPAYKTVTVTVPVDDIPPVATADLGVTPDGQLQLIGGDTALSNALTPFGRSKGLIFDWTGPNTFSSAAVSPEINSEWAWGAYRLVVTEMRNGCKSWATMDVSFSKVQNKGIEEAAGGNEMAAGTFNVWRNPTANRLYILTNQLQSSDGKITVYNANGQVLNNMNVQFNKGQNRIELPLNASNQTRIISVYSGNKLVLTKKVLF